MRKLFLQLTFILFSANIFAVNTVATITSPDGLTEPYKVCYNTEVKLKVDTTGLGTIMYNSGWYTCTEEPDFDGFSNYSLWENTNELADTFTYTLTSEVYIWYTTNVAGGMIGSTPVYSNVIHLQLNGDIPVISYTDTKFCEGSTLTLDVTPSDLGDGNYKWFKDSVEVASATSASLEITEPGNYYAKAITNPTDCPGGYYSSSEVMFEYIKPGITGIFKNDLQRVVLETEINYTSYQWKQASSTISGLTTIDGAITNTYNANITADDLYYAVEVMTDGGCTATSDRILINNNLYSLPVIVEPVDTFGCRSDFILLSLEKESYATYQWYKNSSAIYNATNSTLEVGANYPGGAGIYTVKVTTVIDPVTELESNTINLDFAVQPNISIMDDVKPCPGGKITLQTKPGYNGEVGGYDAYQWYFNDANDISTAIAITGATDSIIEIDVPNETRYYWVKTTLNGCEDESYGKMIQEFSLYAPYISKTPYDGLICLGDTVILKVYSNDVTYQWYFNGNAIDGATEKEYKATDVGYYDIEIASTLCETAEPIMNNDSTIIKYRFTPSFSVTPEGDQWGDNPNHRIFCSGDTLAMSVDNASNYSTWQWMGKLYDVNSTSDEWEDVTGETDSIYSFINGQNNKLRYKVRVDSVMENDEICSAISDYKIIDGHVNQNPAIASFNNSELCSEGDSTLIHLAFPGDWASMEWYLDGLLVPNTNTDTIYAKEVGMWTITCYPNTCPNIPHSSGLGPVVKFMPEAEIWENDTVIYAMPELGYYYYQWYFNDEAINMDTLDIPWIIYKEDLKPGSYTVEVSNPAECTRLSAPYVVVGIEEQIESNINIYPNPVNDNLNISLKDISNVKSIEVYSATGALIKKINNLENSMIIPMSQQQNGIYLIRINYTNMPSSTHRVVKN